MSALMGLALVLIQVTGGSGCPEPEQVAAELERLSPGSPPAGAVKAQARLERIGDGPLIIELRDGGGALLTRRQLSSEGTTCADLASAAALVLLVWERELRSGIDLPLALRRQQVAARRASTTPSHEISAAFVASIDPSRFAPGGRVELRVAAQNPGATGISGHAGFLGSGARELDLGEGRRASWTRLSAVLGLGYRLSLHPRVWLDGQASVLLGAALIQGMKVAAPQSVTAFDPGLAAELRLGFRLGRFSPFLGIAVVGWPVQQDLAISADRVLGNLPRLELLFSLGLSFRMN